MYGATGYGNGTARMMSAPTVGWMRTRSNSSGVSRPGLVRMCSGTASLPMSCSSAATFTPSTSSRGHAGRFAKRGRPRLHAADVVVGRRPIRIDRLVAGVDRARQRLDARQVQV